MKLLTKEILKKLPPLYANDGKKPEDVPVVVKFFTCWSNWTWYATEYDPEQKLFFGLVKGFEAELGYFSLEELEAVTGPSGLKIERDMYFENKTLADVQKD
jgi:hypothetical protein